MPWRETTEPYAIMVSELMLQQTQVERVIPKYQAFMQRFPDIDSLASASLSEVLELWTGLGYNRRAKFLWQAAQRVVSHYGGVMPSSREALTTLPGVGKNTAGAIIAYAYNEPVVYVETNIRSVYFYHFFSDDNAVSDKTISEKVALTLDHEHPREWYWALMDYGSYLKKQGVGRIQKSAHYKKQSPLKGSLREMRGRLIATLAKESYDERSLRKVVQADERFASAIKALLEEGLIIKRDDIYSLP